MLGWKCMRHSNDGKLNQQRLVFEAWLWLRYSKESVQTRIAAILSLDGFVEATNDANNGPYGLILEATPFYAEQGGQIADTGNVASTSGSTFHVQDAQVWLSGR